MKIFGYMDDVIALQLGLEWYWSYGLAIGTVLFIYFVVFLFFRFLGVKKLQG